MTGISTLVDYQIVNRRMSDVRAAVIDRQTEQRDINYFVDNIGKITTGDALLEDTRLYRFAMRAFGLESQIFAKGLMRKVFDEGVEEPLSQANKMTDKRFRDIAAAFRFAEDGGGRTGDANFVAQVVNQYVSVRVEEDQQNDGVRLALYFERNAGRIDSWYDVLADRALGEVARVALGFPTQIANLDIDRYAEKLAERFDVEDLQDPEKLNGFLKKFAIRYDLEQTAASGPSDSRLALFAPLSGGSIGGGLSISGATLAAARTNL